MSDFIKKYIVQMGLVGFCVLVFVSSEELAESSRAFPRTMAVTLIVLVALLILTNYVKQKKSGIEAANPVGNLNARTTIILISFIVLNILFVWLLPIVGFEIIGFIFILCGMIMLGGKSAARFWWIAIALPIVLGFVFRTLLDLRLPMFPFIS